jgi:hypothetical protein
VEEQEKIEGSIEPVLYKNASQSAFRKKSIIPYSMARIVIAAIWHKHPTMDGTSWLLAFGGHDVDMFH